MKGLFPFGEMWWRQKTGNAHNLSDVLREKVFDVGLEPRGGGGGSRKGGLAEKLVGGGSSVT